MEARRKSLPLRKNCTRCRLAPQKYSFGRTPPPWYHARSWRAWSVRASPLCYACHCSVAVISTRSPTKKKTKKKNHSRRGLVLPGRPLCFSVHDLRPGRRWAMAGRLDENRLRIACCHSLRDVLVRKLFRIASRQRRDHYAPSSAVFHDLTRVDVTGIPPWPWWMTSSLSAKANLCSVDVLENPPRRGIFTLPY